MPIRGSSRKSGAQPSLTNRSAILNLATTASCLALSGRIRGTTMPFLAQLSRTSRRVELVALGGAAGFAAGIGAFVLLGPHWLARLLSDSSAAIGAVLMGVIFALAASTLAAIVVIIRVRT